jgi:uncharacterized small protein (TIGR04563 family)
VLPDLEHHPLIDLFGLPLAASDKRKQRLYFPADVLGEIAEAATRPDRSLPWSGQKAWRSLLP